jgi:hypothetical protein
MLNRAFPAGVRCPMSDSSKFAITVDDMIWEELLYLRARSFDAWKYYALKTLPGSFSQERSPLDLLYSHDVYPPRLEIGRLIRRLIAIQ